MQGVQGANHVNMYPTGRAWLRAALPCFLSVVLAACGGSDDDDGRQPPVATSVALFAGPQDQGGSGREDGPAGQARLMRPQALAVATDGSVYIGERQSIRRLDSHGVVSTVYRIGELPASGDRPVGQIDELGALTFGPDGAVYAVARWATRRDSQDRGSRAVVLRLSNEGTAAVVADAHTDAGADVNGPSSLAFDRHGRLWLGDAWGCRLWRVDQPGARWTVQRSTRPEGRACDVGAGRGWGVQALAIDHAGGVIYALSNGELRRLADDGGDELLARVRNFKNWETALALDGRGRVLVIDPERPCVLRLEGGAWAVVAGLSDTRGWFDGPADEARMDQPAALAVAADGALLVADRGNHTLRRVDEAGHITTLAGRALQAAWRDGTGEQARFGWGPLLAALPDGSLRVSEPYNGTLRQVDGAGRVTTLAGPAWRCCNQADGVAATASFSWLGPLLAAPDGSVLVVDSEGLHQASPAGVIKPLPWAPMPGTLQALAGSMAQPVLAYGDTDCTPQACWSTFGIVRADGHGGWQTLLRSEDWPAATARIDLITALVDGDDGELFFAMGDAVYRRRVDGSVQLLAGRPGESGHRDGTGADALFDHPVALARDRAGRLFVSDSVNGAVRVITTDARVHTLAEFWAPGSLAVVPGGLVVADGVALMKITF